ncbi:MAG: CRTAC1 family protein [Bryobacterales bacterium]|nr:CRTAC1 family protein [Bryobacterales bacterium]
MFPPSCKETLVAAALCACLGCGRPVPEAETSARSPAPSAVVFTDVTRAAGIRFEHHNGRSGRKYLPETLGSGCAFFDYDNDGLPDIFLVNSKPWAGSAEGVTSKLYRNAGGGRFEDVSEAAGLAAPMYGLGVAAADYDNDGFSDLYVTVLDGDRLFRNQGDGTFEDVTARAGIDNARFGTSAAWFDYDLDGHLDLLVANYVQWSAGEDLWCSMDGSAKTYCTPESYAGQPSVLYRNRGDGTFEDASARAGLDDPTAKALGIAILDYDSDGWPDVFQANDTQPNKLYRNEGDGTFSEHGVSAGVAYAEDGKARGAMGVDAADYDRSGRFHLLVGNFANEMLNLFHNEGNGLFVDEAPTSTLGRDSLLSLTFGAFFFDYDLAGHADIFCANGHLDEEIEIVQPAVRFAQAPLLFRNDGRGGFAAASPGAGRDLEEPLVGRGAAYADYDRDGDLDILITTNDGPAKLLRNDGGNANNYLRVRLEGAESNRSGLGTLLTLDSASGQQRQLVRGGSSYCSQSEIVATFGLGADLSVESLEARWPSGRIDRLEGLEPNREIVLSEGGAVRPAAAVPPAPPQ